MADLEQGSRDPGHLKKTYLEMRAGKTGSRYEAHYKQRVVTAVREIITLTTMVTC